MLAAIPLIKLIIQVAAFVLVMALWLAMVLLWGLHRSQQTRKIQNRLGIVGAHQNEEAKVLRLWHRGGVAETTVMQDAHRGLMQRLDQLREDAGWSATMPRILLALLGVMAMVALALYVITGSLLMPAISAILILVGFRALFQRSITSRSGLFMRQFVDGLELAARSLRAGHPLSGSFHLIAEEIPAPVGTLFGEMCEQEALGVSLPDALEQAARESRSPDMKIFAASVVIQLRSGGNLADMMERVTWVIRERMRLSRRARVLTAEAQLSKWVLLALPLGLFLAINVLNPSYMQPMYSTTVGQIMLASSGLGLLLGSWVMDRMATLKY